MAIPEIILREIIEASTPEGSNLPHIKAKYLMIGMSVDLSEYFVKLKHEIETTHMAPDLINAVEVDRIINTTTDEWLCVTSVISDNTNKTITIDTDNPLVPPLRLPEDERVMVLIGDDASKQDYTTPKTFLDYLEEVREQATYNSTTLHNFIQDRMNHNQRLYINHMQSWDDFRDYLISYEAPGDVIAAASYVWNDYKDAL